MICKRVTSVERRRREDRGAEGTEVTVCTGETSEQKGIGLPPSHKNVSTLDLKITTAGAFWALFLQFSCLFAQKNSTFWLVKLAAVTLSLR